MPLPRHAHVRLPKEQRHLDGRAFSAATFQRTFRHPPIGPSAPRAFLAWRPNNPHCMSRANARKMSLPTFLALRN